MRLTRFTFFACIIFTAGEPVSAFGIFNEVRRKIEGVITDPLKLQKSSETVYNSINAATAALADLQARTDTSVDGWLDEISSIISDANSGVEARIRQAEKAALALEERAMNDMAALLADLECSAERFANEVVQRSLINAINTLIAANITVDLPIVGEQKLINIDEPPDIENDELYRAYKRSKLAQLYADVEKNPEELDPNDIISAYQNISERAFAVHCHYTRSGGDVRFLADHYEYRAKLRPWLNGVFRVPT